MKYGPNTYAVDDLRKDLKNFLWFENVEKNVDFNGNFCRVDFDWIIQNDGFEKKSWGDILTENETRIERLIFNNARLGYRTAISEDFKLEDHIEESVFDNFYYDIDEKYAPEGSYYKDTFNYPHEYISSPQHLITWAALEIMVSDLDNNIKFFSNLLPYLKKGFWPIGWQGEPDNGKIALW